MSIIGKIINNLLQHKLLLFFIGIAALIILFTFKDYGVPWDTADNRNLGMYSYNYYTHLGRDNSYFKFYNQKEFYMTRGPLFELVVYAIETAAGTYSFNLYQIILGLFFLIGYISIYGLLYLLTRNKIIGVLGSALLFLSPRLYGEIFSNSKDTAPVYFLALALLLSLIIFKNSHKNKWLLIGSGAMYGILLGLRFFFIYIPLLFTVFYVINELISRTKLREIILNLCIFMLSVIPVLYLTQPYLHIHPIDGLWSMLRASSQFPWSGKVFFDGKQTISSHLPSYYLIKWILISVPIITLLFTSVGIILPLIKAWKKNAFRHYITDFFIISLIAIPLIMVFITKPILYDGWRHFLFLNVPIIVLAGLGVYYLALFNNRIVTVVVVLLLLINILLTGYQMINLHPYEYIYFNELVGYLPHASKSYETDYYGRSFKEAAIWLKNYLHVHGIKSAVIATCGNSSSSTTYFDNTMVFTSDLKNADYFICYTRTDEYKKGKGKILHIVTRFDVPLNYIVQLR